MGIHCEINLLKRSGGDYRPGSIVSGVIRYGADEDTNFKKITVSLKGYGVIFIQDIRWTRRNTFVKHEDYVDIDNIVLNNDKGVPMSIGLYETAFKFKLPYEIPPSLDRYDRNDSYRVRCHILYYIHTKFERSGFMKFDKRFKTILTVVGGLTPKLSIEPILYEEKKTLFQLFKIKDSIVNIKANVKNSVIRPGGKVEIEYEVLNDTNLTLNEVEIKLIEVYTFKSEVKMTSELENTDSKTGPVKNGQNQIKKVSIPIPLDKSTLQFSSIVSRDYFVCFTVEMPFPHRNIVLRIPIEIGDEIKETESEPGPSVDPPPSYWETMEEDNAEKSSF